MLKFKLENLTNPTSSYISLDSTLSVTFYTLQPLKDTMQSQLLNMQGMNLNRHL